MAGSAIVGGAVIGAGASMFGSSTAAAAQTSAADQANATQMAMFNRTQANMAPYMNLGAQGAGALGTATGMGTANPLTSQLLAPINMDQATLQQTPGYQFNLTQGLKATQNAAAARGLGVSGAALKGAASYATGLADTTYQNQFANAVTNQTNQFNRLMGITNIGQSSAAGVSAQGTATGQGIAQTQASLGNALGANAISQGNAVGSIGSSLPTAYLLSNMSKSPATNPITGGPAV